MKLNCVIEYKAKTEFAVKEFMQTCYWRNIKVVTLNRDAAIANRITDTVNRITVTINRITVKASRNTVTVNRFTVKVNRITVMVNRITVTVNRNTVKVNRITVTVNRFTVTVNCQCGFQDGAHETILAVTKTARIITLLKSISTQANIGK